MSMPSFAQKWLGLLSRVALLFGIGALSAAGAKAEATPIDEGKQGTRVPQQSAKSFGEMRVWSDNGRIYLSESGGEARELALSDTPEARHLSQLLWRDRAVADAPQVLQHRIILVGGGGAGLHWTPPWQTASPETTVAPTVGNAPGQPADRAQGPIPRTPKASATPAGASRNAKD
jgi:hypothetical protein